MGTGTCDSSLKPSSDPARRLLEERERSSVIRYSQGTDNHANDVHLPL
jgi:hypothetical protein